MQPVVNLVQGDVTEISTNHFSVKIMRRMNESFSLSLFDTGSATNSLSF